MDFLNHETVSLVVGENKDKFMIHRGLLESSSSFFRAALSEDSAFKEASSGIVSMPEDDGDLVAHFANWLYSESLKLSPMDQVNGKEALTERTVILCRIYGFADKYDIKKLGNHVIDLFFEWVRADAIGVYMQSTDISTAYKYTGPTGSGLRNLIVRWAIFRSTDAFDDHEELKNLLNDRHEIAIDLALNFVAIEKDEQKENPFEDGPGAYYTT